MKAQFENLKKQKATIDDRQKRIKARAREDERQANAPPRRAIPDVNNNNSNNNDNQNATNNNDNCNNEEGDEDSINSVEAWAEGLEAEEAANANALVVSKPVAALDQVAKAVEQHRKQHIQEEGGDYENLQIRIPDAADRVAPLGPAPKIKIKDLMPKGQANPNQPTKWLTCQTGQTVQSSLLWRTQNLWMAWPYLARKPLTN